MHLDSFFEGDGIDLHRLAEVLDGMGHAGRVETVRRWGKREQARLYEAIKGHMPLTLDYFVPGTLDPLVPVIHEGKNSLPAFTHFQKRFCKPKEKSGDTKEELWGYNEGSAESMLEIKPFTGPGYFCVHTPEGRDGSEGEIDIDYRKIPSAKPESWPEIIPNEAKLGRFIYAGMVDVMRGLSNHVSIGRAMKGGKWMDAWFVLVRQDVPTA
jgi:hypothetical protein